MHCVAPAECSAFVTEPAAHGTHACVDLVLYVPAAQAVQAVAEGAFSVSVTDPGGQSAQASSADLLNWPALHAEQVVLPLPIVDPGEQDTHLKLFKSAYCPAGHGTQVDAPGDFGDSVKDPVLQTAQATVDLGAN